MPRKWPYKFAFALAVSFLAASCAPHKPPPPTTQPIATPQDIPGIRNFAWVSPFLCRGAQPTRAGFEQLRNAGVKTIVNVRGKTTRDDVEGLGLKYIQIPSSASKPDEQQIVDFIRAIRDPQNRPVFVHDEAGADRAGLYVGAYHIVEEGWTASDVDVELGQFHFNRYWTQIPRFLHQLNADRIRTELSIAPTTRATTRSTTRPTSRTAPKAGSST
jgi:protein tyrosine phosphatase (PTP) superfamily phosphohydrolase (DUF442 family)